MFPTCPGPGDAHPLSMLFHWFGLDTTGHGNNKLMAKISEYYASAMAQPFYEDCRSFMYRSGIYASRGLVLWILRLIPGEWIVGLGTKLATCFPFLWKLILPTQGASHSAFMKAILKIKQHLTAYDIYMALFNDARFAMHLQHASRVWPCTRSTFSTCCTT